MVLVVLFFRITPISEAEETTSTTPPLGPSETWSGLRLLFVIRGGKFHLTTIVVRPDDGVHPPLHSIWRRKTHSLSFLFPSGRTHHSAFSLVYYAIFLPRAGEVRPRLSRLSFNAMLILLGDEGT
jgi:hypothetical protein